MDVLRKIGGNETTTHLPKVFQDYLPSQMPNSQKMKESFNLASDHVSIIRGKLMEYSPLLMKYVGVTVDAARATLPYLKKYVVVTMDAARATLPYLKNIEVYCVAKIKQHPYLVGFIAILVLFKWCASAAGGNTRKMMKAPGRNYMMPRDVFESSPRSYFQSERKRK